MHLNDYHLSVVKNAVEQSHVAVFSNMGQCCVAGTRTFVHEDIYDEFVKKSKEHAQKRVVGDPYDLNTQSGPQVTKGFPKVTHGLLDLTLPFELKLESVLHLFCKIKFATCLKFRLLTLGTFRHDSRSMINLYFTLQKSK